MTDPTPQTTPTRDEAVLNPLALEALENNQRQLDMDGVEVGVSRQALDELLSAYKAAVASVNRATDAEIGGIHRTFAPASPPAEALQAGVDVEALAKAASDEVLRSYKVLRAEELALTVSTAVKMRAKALTRALSSAPAQEDGSKDLGAHPRDSGQNSSRELPDGSPS